MEPNKMQTPMDFPTAEEEAKFPMGQVKVEEIESGDQKGDLADDGEACAAQPEKEDPQAKEPDSEDSGEANGNTKKIEPKKDTNYVKLLASFPLLLNDQVCYDGLNDSVEIFAVDPEDLQPVGQPCPYFFIDEEEQN